MPPTSKKTPDTQPSLLGGNGTPAPAQQPAAAQATAPQGEKTTALAKVEPAESEAAIVMSAGDAFADFELSPEMERELDDLAPEFDKSDVSLAYWVFNIQKDITDADGNVFQTRRNQFVNTQTDRVVDQLEVVFMHREKTNEWSYFDNEQNKKIRMCFSADQVTGDMLADFGDLKKGQKRPCENCPQAQWRAVEDPKTRKQLRTLDCAPIHNFILIDPDTTEPGMVRFKRSSERPAKAMLNKFFIGKRITKDASGITRRKSYPLFTFRMSITLKMDPAGKFSVPEFRMMRPLNKTELPQYVEQARFLQQYMGKAMKLADKADEVLDREEQVESESFDAEKLEKQPVDPGASRVTEATDNF